MNNTNQPAPGFSNGEAVPEGLRVPEAPEPGVIDMQNLGFLPDVTDTLGNIPEAPEMPEEPTPPVAPEASLPPKDNPDRYEFWQSRYDRLRREHEEFVAQVQAGFNPQMPNAAQAPLAGLPGTPAPASPELKEPAPPKKPRHYDPTEAITNPDSDSFKYRLELEEYRDARAEFLEKKITMQQQAMEAATQAALIARQQETFLNQQRAQLASLGMVGQQAEEFLAWASRPEVELQDLVALHRLKYGGGSPQPTQPTKTNPQQRAQAAVAARKQPLPPSLAAASGGGPEMAPQLTDDQRMSAAFLAAGKRF